MAWLDAGHYTPHSVEEFRDLQTWKYFYLVGFSFLVWDWLITFHEEVEHIWMRERTMFTYLWAMLRYFPLLMYCVATYTLFQKTWEPEVCNHLAVVPTIFVISLILIVHVVFALRTYALYGRSKLVRNVFVPLLIVEAGVMVWTGIDERLTHVPKGWGCIPASPRRIQGVVTWSAPFAYDSVVFGFTLFRSIQFIRSQSKVPIVHVIIRDGVAYFGIMCVFYLANILLYIFAPLGLQDINAAFATTITVVCTQRLIFNLRDAPSRHGPEPDSTTAHDSHVPYILSQPTALIQTWLTDIGGVLDRRHGRHRSGVGPHATERGASDSIHPEYALNDIPTQGGWYPDARRNWPPV